MSEVLPRLAHLSRLFQAEYLQLSMIQPYLNACITSIKSYKDTATAPDVSETDKSLTDLLKDFNIIITPDSRDNFDHRVRQPFLDLLLQNIVDRFPSVELLGAFDIFTPHLPNEEVDSKSKERLVILLAHYGSEENVLVNGNDLYNEWETFSIMLKNHYAGIKAKEVMKDLATETLGQVIHN